MLWSVFKVWLSSAGNGVVAKYTAFAFLYSGSALILFWYGALGSCSLNFLDILDIYIYIYDGFFY